LKRFLALLFDFILIFGMGAREYNEFGYQGKPLTAAKSPDISPPAAPVVQGGGAGRA
jgi:hypothetical protein